MKCPLCDRKIPVESTPEHYPYFSCTTRVTPDPPGTGTITHYSKHHLWNGSYEEEVIVLPYKIVNYFHHNEFGKPRSEIHKYKLVDSQPFGKRWTWVRILTLPNILEILKYKKMQDRLKTIILFS